jgi:hypothetical protein
VKLPLRSAASNSTALIATRKGQLGTSFPSPFYHTQLSLEFSSLNLQHTLLTHSFAFLLHPYITYIIPLSLPGLRIADFGTGTGIFPLSLASLLHPSSTITGFDISSAQFPPQESLPQNVQLYEWDISVPLP